MSTTTSGVLLVVATGYLLATAPAVALVAVAVLAVTTDRRWTP